MANTGPRPRVVALVLVPALVLMLAFAFFYVGAFLKRITYWNLIF